MKRIVLLTTTAVLLLIGKLSAQNVFDQNDSVVTYDATKPSGSVWNPVVPNNGVMAKWIRTTAAYQGRQVTFGTTVYKAYIWNQMPFRMIYPKSYQQGVSDGKTYPIVVFWHGGGEIGPITNNELQLLNGGDLFQNKVASGEFDGFMIFPQETAIGWEPYFSRVMNVLDTLYKYCKVDRDRVISMGLSIGGQGAASFANLNPGRVARIIAASPTKVGTLMPTIPNFLQIPMWIASGGLDTDPAPAPTLQFDTTFISAGGSIIYDFFPNDDHHTWYDQWARPYFNSQLNTAHKANPLVYWQRNVLCPDSVINVRMGLTAGFYAYQWDSNGVVIPGATASEFYAKGYGTYRARFQRTATSDWSAWSPNPVIVSYKPRYSAPPITTQGPRSSVLPGADSSYTVPLMEPKGVPAYNYQSFRWVRAVDTAIVSSAQVFVAGVGQYKAAVMDTSGCYSSWTPVYTVTNANGTPKPDRPKSLNAYGQSGSTVLLDWNKNATVVNAPTGFEIYRGTKSGGPYTYAGLASGSVLSYTDTALLSNVTYYYIIRPVSATGAGAISNEAVATTLKDTVPPTAPSNLVAGSYTTRQSVDLSWSASTDNVGVYKYDVYANGVKMYSTDSLFATVYNLLPLKSYVFTVKARDKAGNSSQPSNQVTASTLMSGLKWKSYLGSWAMLPNFSLLPVKASGVSSFPDLSVRPAEDYFGFVWEGYITVPQAGTYTFGLKSDDGSAMWINSSYNFNKTPTVNNDGAHDNSATKTGTYNFPAAGTYPIAISFFEASGGQSIQVYWSGPGVSGSLVATPTSAFTDAVPAATPPTAPTLPTATVNSYRQITVGWKDNSTTETGFEIVRGTSSAGPFTSLATAAAATQSFVDTFALNPSTAYYYKIRAVGTGGASAFISTSGVTTQALPAAPAAPSGLGITVNSNKQVTLNWTDNSSVEIAQEIWRSSNDASNYRVIATVNPGVANYVDATVQPNETYLYKVRAKVVGNFSAYSNEVTGRTLDSKPTLALISDFTMKYSTQFVLPIRATDPDNDDITFTYLKLPAFATATTVSGNSVNLTFAPGPVAQGAYNIGVVANDNNGKTDTIRFNLLVNSNNPPVIATINNVTIDEGATTNFNVSATDVESTPNIVWTFTNLPSFATFTNNGNGNGNIALAPGYAASGVYTVTALVNDGYGGKATQNFTITVNDKSPNTKWYVNVYFPGYNAPYNSTAPAPWNNVGSTSTNLLNSAGQTTTVGVTISAPSGITLYSYGTGTGNNSGYYPDVVLRDNYYLAVGRDTGKIAIKNLIPGTVYNFRFMSGTQNSSENASSRTVFSAGSKVDSVLDKNNTKLTAYLGGITADASGNVTVKWYRGAAAGTNNAYINAFEIEQVYNDGTVPAKAQGIASTFIPGSGAKITWKDIAYNETSYKVFRSSTNAGPYTQLNLGATNPNDTSYLDATASPSATYYYYVLASNSVGDSPSSDTTMLVIGNNPPIIGTVSDLYVKAGSSASVSFTPTDDPGDVLTATVPDLPTSFAALSKVGNTYTVTANASADNVGFYTATINVADDKGGVSTKTFKILVSDSSVRTALLHIGKDGSGLAKPWNNLTSGFPTANLKTSAMTDDAGLSVPWGVMLVNQFDGYFSNGFKTGNDAGVVPDTALAGGVYVGSTTTPRTFKLTGLDPTKTYSLGFVSSVNAGDNYTAVVSSGSQTVTFNASYNSNILPRLNGLVPAADSTISVNVLKASNANTALINALIIQEYNATTTPYLSPSNLMVEPSDTNKIRLTWSDRTNNETNVEVWRATAYAGPYTLISTLPASSVTFNDSVATNIRYYYKVRVKNGGSYSAYSNIATTTSLSGIVLVNMNTTNANGVVWNNTGKVPAVGDVFSLKNPTGYNTGYTMTIVSNFSNSGNGGSSTGGNRGVFPDSVMVSNYVIAKGSTVTLKFSNLDQSKRYRIGFSGSSNTWSASYNTTYSIGNRTVYLNALYDTIKAVYIDGVVPNANGEITANISTTSDATYGLLNAIVLQAYTYTPAGFATDNPVASQAIRINTGVAADSSARKDSTKRSAAELAAYPNPFNDYLNLEVITTNTIDKLDIEIYDSNGKIMFAKVFNSVSSGRNTIRISTAEANLQQGVYFMRVHSNDGATNSVIKLLKINR